MRDPFPEAQRPKRQGYVPPPPTREAVHGSSHSGISGDSAGSSESGALGVMDRTGASLKRGLLIGVGVVLGVLCLGGGMLTAIDLAARPQHQAARPAQQTQQATLPAPAAQSGPRLHAPKSAIKVRTGHLDWRDISAQAEQAYHNAGHAGDQAFWTTMAGDLDGDGLDELVISGSGFKQILRLDGTPCGAYAQVEGEPLCLWDSNGDGKAEIIRNVGSLEAADMQGKLVEHLPYRPINASTWGSYPLIGDADGDGKPELWLRESGDSPHGIVALSPDGKVVVSAKLIGNVQQALVCDFHGNGHSVLVLTNSEGKLQDLGIDGLQEDGYISNDLPLTGCQELSGDNMPDLLCGEVGFRYHAERGLHTYVPLGDFHPPASSINNYLTFDIDGDGKPEQVYLGPDANDPAHRDWNSTLARLRAYNPATGEVLYDETLNRASPLGFARARAKSKDYLVVAEGDKLLIFP